MEKKFLEAGQIVNTHGVRGEVKVLPWADGPEFLLDFKTLYIDGQAMRVRSSRVQKTFVVLGFEGIDDINAAMRLKQKTVCIDRADARLPEGRFFVVDLLGASVRDEQGREIGRLREILDLPAGQVYLVWDGKTEHQIPAVPEFVLHTDLEAGIITVRMIEGM